VPLRNLISIPRFDSMLSKLLGIKERSIAPTVATELIPVIPVQSPNAGELYFTRGERILSLHDQVAEWGNAVDSLANVAIFANPPGSRTLVIVERIQIYPSPEDQAAGTFTSDVHHDVHITASFDSSLFVPGFWARNNVGVWRDTRWFVPSNPGGNAGHVAEFWKAQQLAAVAPFGASTLWSDVSSTWLGVTGVPECAPWNYWGREIVLAPGGALIWTCAWRSPPPAVGGNPGIISKFDIQWRERPLEDSEQRPGSS
jgi:hypothetical protein